MANVEGLPHAVGRLLDAGELEHVLEPVSAIAPVSLPLMVEGASLHGIALESIIQNTPYFGVVLPPRTPRVEIGGKRSPRGDGDECAILVSAQHTMWNGMLEKINGKKYLCVTTTPRGCVHLLGKERQKDVVLPLAVQE